MPQKRSSETVVGSFNLYQRSNDRRAHAALIEFSKHVDIAGLQEFGGNHRRNMLHNLRGFDFYKPRSVPTAPPIIWRKDRFRFISGDAPVVAKGRRVLHVPGKRAVLDDLHGSFVLLWDEETNQKIRVGNLHTVAHVENWTGARRRMYRESLYATGRELQPISAHPVFLAGDWNWNLMRKDDLPTKILHGKFHLDHMWMHHRPNGGTHGKRVIDAVWSNQRCTYAKILHGIDVGDHEPVIGRYRVAVL